MHLTSICCQIFFLNNPLSYIRWTVNRDAQNLRLAYTSDHQDSSCRVRVWRWEPWVVPSYPELNVSLLHSQFSLLHLSHPITKHFGPELAFFDIIFFFPWLSMMGCFCLLPSPFTSHLSLVCCLSDPWIQKACLPSGPWPFKFLSFEHFPRYLNDLLPLFI